MGDRCYLRLTCPRKDREFWENEGLCVCEDEEGLPLVMEDAECNYGLWEQRHEAAKAGKVFHGWHDPGGGYSGLAFASDGTKCDEIDAIDGEPVVPVTRQGVTASDLQDAREYFETLDRAMALIGKEIASCS